jgi:hypothetical protein
MAVAGMYVTVVKTTSLAVGLLTLATLAVAQSETAAPGVGTKIPAFSLPDQDGNRQTFESIRGPKGAMLVFYRSADW